MYTTDCLAAANQLSFRSIVFGRALGSLSNPIICSPTAALPTTNPALSTCGVGCGAFGLRAHFLVCNKKNLIFWINTVQAFNQSHTLRQQYTHIQYSNGHFTETYTHTLVIKLNWIVNKRKHIDITHFFFCLENQTLWFTQF